MLMARQAKKVFYSSFLVTYKEVKQIGQGGNSTVYEVINEEEEKFALKLLNKNIDNDGKKRFKNEINFCTKSNNKNLIKIIDNGIYELNGINTMFYVMPLYSMNLRELMKKGIPDDKKIDYFNQILEGVKFLHKDNNYHRDLKPENILYDEKNDNLIVSDLGISHFNKNDLYTIVETKTTSRMANFAYAAPEQKIKGALVDQRSDIYALGLILNELFTGCVPYGTKHKKIKDVKPDYYFLDTIVDWMISQEKEDRPENIESIQGFMNVKIQLANKENEIQKLKEIKYEESEEKDIIILDPPRVVAAEYIESSGRLRFTLNVPINDTWVDCIRRSDRTEILSYSLDYFRFEGKYASIQVNIKDLDFVQKIIDYFKEWIKKANLMYPKVVMRQRELARIAKEKEIKDEILKKEKISTAMNELKI